MMECCGKSVCGSLLHCEMQRVVSFGPVVECGMPARSWGATKGGGRRPGHGAGDLLPCCQCARRADGFFSKSGASNPVRARWPNLFKPYCVQTRRGCLVMARAEEGHGSEETTEPAPANLGPPIIIKKSSFLTSTDLWLQVVIFVVTAGFVDAGFSGDWSRIGVLSKQTEEELQMAAVGVVPLAVTLIWSISQRKKQQQ